MSDLATISYQPEAHDSALTAYDRLVGFTVRVVSPDSKPFDAELLYAGFDADGDLVLRLAPWDDALDAGDHDAVATYLAYNLDRIEVL